MDLKLIKNYNYNHMSFIKNNQKRKFDKKNTIIIITKYIITNLELFSKLKLN